MKSNVRKYLALFFAIILYFFIHEGAHLVFAMAFGVFKEIRFLGLGMQIAITDPGLLTNFQFAVFNIAGAISSLTTAYILVALTKRICKSSNAVFKAICYYSTVALLFTDPIYLSILCGFFGGGDMNGIIMFGISEWAVHLMFAAVLVFNICLFFRSVYPAYKTAFKKVAM